MFKITKTYKDFDGNERTEDFYFNFTVTELQKMQMSKDGGLDKFVDKISKANDLDELIILWQDLLLKAYGEKSADGRRFDKSDEIRHNFECSKAFDEIYRELSTNTEEAIRFFNQLIPEELRKEVAAKSE